METILVGFQNNLGGISHDIKHLQEQSITMNQKLRNRKKLEKRLNAFLSNVAIAPGTVNGIMETSPNDSVFVSYLMELNTLLNFARQPANVEIPFKPEDIEGDNSRNGKQPLQQSQLEKNDARKML
jgi:hypothetical protein